MTSVGVKSRVAAIVSWPDEDLCSFVPCSNVGGDYTCWLGFVLSFLDLLQCVSVFSEGDAASLGDVASVVDINAISTRTTLCYTTCRVPRATITGIAPKRSIEALARVDLEGSQVRTRSM